MPRTITVKGVGKVTAAPDYIVISMNLESKAMEYDKAAEQAAEQINELNTSLEAVGFEKKSLKTISFNVRADYKSERDPGGNYRNVFDGYVCSHRLKAEFDFDTKRLAETVNAISNCMAKPSLNIAFTVKDPSAVNKELLKSAAENAREKAKILCEASDVSLGSLISIDYNWNEHSVVSRTNYALEEKCMAMPKRTASDIEFTPDDINVSDTAEFVWEIK